MGGPGPIPWTAIDQYGHRYKYVGEDFDALVHYVEVLDGIYLQFCAEDGKKDGSTRKGAK